MTMSFADPGSLKVIDAYVIDARVWVNVGRQNKHPLNLASRRTPVGSSTSIGVLCWHSKRSKPAVIPLCFPLRPGAPITDAMTVSVNVRQCTASISIITSSTEL